MIQSGKMLIAAALLSGAAIVHAQDYPTKPIRMVVPFPAGGGSDLIARVTAQKLSAALGQQMVVDNRAGASGNIAAELVSKSPADGYTLLFANSSLALSPSLYRKLPFDSVRDFTPISMVSSYPFALVAHPSLPVRNVKELVALAKARPDAMTYASAGPGTMSNLAVQNLRLSTGISVVHLPYKGAAPATLGLMSGESQFAFVVMPVAGPQVKGGKLRGLAVAAPNRSAVLPQLPTMREAGFDGQLALQWNGFFSPAKTPQPILDRLQREIVRALADAEVKQRFAAEGADPVGNTPAEFAAFFRGESERWGGVIKRSGTRLD